MPPFVNASPDEVAITSNTTEGLNFVINGLDLKAGDEVLMSNPEHPGHVGPWKLKEKRAGIVIKEVPLSPTARSVDEIVGAFAAAITPKPGCSASATRSSSPGSSCPSRS